MLDSFDLNASGPLFEYVQRMLRWQHMDFEYTIWQMLQLCVNPSRAYRTTLYHSCTKHAWARDDPAFVVVLVYLLFVVSIAWSLAFGARSLLSMMRLFAYVVTIDFALLGATLATMGWWAANKYLTVSASHDSASGAQPHETVEWRCACN